VDTDAATAGGDQAHQKKRPSSSLETSPAKKTSVGTDPTSQEEQVALSKLPSSQPLPNHSVPPMAPPQNAQPVEAVDVSTPLAKKRKIEEKANDDEVENVGTLPKMMEDSANQDRSIDQILSKTRSARCSADKIDLVDDNVSACLMISISSCILICFICFCRRTRQGRKISSLSLWKMMKTMTDSP
jgi:hypothetical protein